MGRGYLALGIGVGGTACLAQIQQPNQAAASRVAAVQEPSTGSQERASVSRGDRTVVGCVAMGAPGYVLKTDDGSTFPLRSITDLAPYVGNKVQIHPTWTAPGAPVPPPLHGTRAAPPPPRTCT